MNPNVYGNFIWHNATDNKEKLCTTVKKENLKKITKLLDDAEMNFLANEDNPQIAINESDVSLFRKVVGDHVNDDFNFQGPSTEHLPPKMNIFGNIPFKSITQRKFLSGEPDFILKIAETLYSEGILFSGRVYSSKNAKITVSENEYERAKSIFETIKSKREMLHVHEEARSEDIKNEEQNIPKKQNAYVPTFNFEQREYTQEHFDAMTRRAVANVIKQESDEMPAIDIEPEQMSVETPVEEHKPRYTYLSPKKEKDVPHDYLKNVLLRGTGFVGGKERVLKIFENEVDEKQRQKLIKKEYGLGGAGWPIEGYGLHGYDSFNGKGLKINWRDEEGEKEGIVTWRYIEKELGVLIMTGEYSTEKKSNQRVEEYHLDEDETPEIDEYAIPDEPESYSEEEPKQIVTFTVAESTEFHNFGQYFDGIHSLDEAVKIYDNLKEKSVLHAIPALGINLHIEGTPLYDDEQWDFLAGDRIDLDSLHFLPNMSKNSEVSSALHRLAEIYPNAEIIGGFENLPREIVEKEKAVPLYSLSDITNIKYIGSEYTNHGHVAEHTFEADFLGEHTTIRYEVTRHDDDEQSFYIATENCSFVDEEYLSMNDIHSLEALLSDEVRIGRYEHKIEKVETSEELNDIRYEYMDDESFPTRLNERFHEAFDEKAKELSGENIDKAVEKEPLQQAKDLINDYSLSEFDNEADFSDLEHIDLADTEWTDDETGKEHRIQVSVDLLNYRLDTWVDGDLIESNQYGSLEELISNELSYLSFDSLVSLSYKALETLHEKEINEEAAKAIDEHEAEYGADGRRVFPHLNEDKTTNQDKHSEWSVTANPVGGEMMYSVYRLIDSSAVDHSSNRENPCSYVTDRKLMEQLADELNANGITELDAAKKYSDRFLAERQESQNEEVKEDENIRITDRHLGEGTPKEKFRKNIMAIQLLKKIEEENRPALPDEKEILLGYVGWGGLSDAFDENKTSWQTEYNELKAVLTPQEYNSARASTLDAFYTSPVIIDGIYQALDKFGYKGGKILEPALGIGNFLGRIPASMSDETKFYGHEIDDISGRIAKKLYPNADIKIDGFEKNEYMDNSFDVAVGNVPFGELSFVDDKHKTNKLHDYFFAETLDKVKNGGIVAFITSTGTLDKKDESVRRMIAEKADLVGAIRLPSGAFKANAGTDVTSDIIFLQKRNTLQKDVPEWVHIGESENGLPVNSYFTSHPDMILGELAVDTNPLSSGTKVLPYQDKELTVLLSGAVEKFEAVISDDRARQVYFKSENEPDIPVPENLRNYSLFIHDENIYLKTFGKSYEFKYNQKNSSFQRAKSFIELRDTTRDLLEAQEQDKPDDVIKELQDRLNTQYDRFYEKFGLINSKSNKRLFQDDISYHLLTTLERKFDNNKLIEKSDIFTKRTIRPARPITHVSTAMEALTLSVAEKAGVDFEYMEKLTDMSKEQLIEKLRGEIYQLPFSNGVYQTKSEYLSGDIRKKLNAAIEAVKTDSSYEVNVRDLENSLPEPLKAADIEIKIGATWIDPKLYEQFMYETFDTPSNLRSDSNRVWWRKKQSIEVEYSEAANAFNISNKSRDYSVIANKTYGSNYLNAYAIMESLLNLKDPKVTMEVDVPGEDRKKRVVDIEATKIVQRKAEKIKSAWKDWIFSEPERREELVKLYNDKFNCIRPREYDGSNLRFPNMNADIKMKSHQKNAIAHALFGGNTLFAHCVGAGKTFEMIASAMESKRLGLSTKALMVVPNHITEQIGSDFMLLYPSANILVATKNDFTKANRQKLFSKIATGNYDAVIIGHSQLKAIPISQERQEGILQQQIEDITEGIREAKEKEDGNSFSVKAMERTKKSLQKNLEKLRAKKQDDVITFEQMGIDKLIVDEAHEFKNLFTPTKLQNISGISTSASQKALDLFMKCRYLDEKTGGKGVIMATGTPLSNSVTELHTMMRYLEYDFLKEKGLDHFDNWISVFGNQKTDWELAPAGNKFKQKTRIADYTGLPELISMFKQVADVRTADTLDLDVPECEMHVVNVEPTEMQKSLVQELADRADDVQAGAIQPEDDNMLKITSDGRKLGLDPRLIDPDIEDDPNTKINQCVNNVYRIFEETSENNLTQIVFCDLGVPHKDTSGTVNDSAASNDEEKSVSELNSLEEECDFCVYDDIKKKLIGRGVPEEQIAYIHYAKTEKQKSELFSKVKKGEVRILLGSTAKMGTGTNVQDKLFAVHDLDIPWRPADMEQRKGRIVRQGNENKKVHVYRYVTKGTFDAYSYQTLENKQKFISQIMTSKTPVRKCEDVDQQSLSYAEIKALCTGDDRIKEKMQLDNEVKELNLLKAEHRNIVYEMQDKIRNAPNQEKHLLETLENLQKDQEHIQRLKKDPETNKPVFGISLNEKTYSDRTEAAKAFKEVTYKALSGKPDTWTQIGHFQGFNLSVYMDSYSNSITAKLQGTHSYRFDLGVDFPHNLRKLENVYNIDRLIDDTNTRLLGLRSDVKEAEKLVMQPFAHEEELKTKSERLIVLTDELNEKAQAEKLANPDRKRTNYFDIAKLKKESQRCRTTSSHDETEKPKKKESELIVEDR